MESKIKEITEIIKMKKEQGDYVSLAEARHIEEMLSNVLVEARKTLTDYGQRELDKRLA